MKKIVGALAVFADYICAVFSRRLPVSCGPRMVQFIEKTGLDAKRNCDRHHLGHPVCPDLPFSSHCICCVFI